MLIDVAIHFTNLDRQPAALFLTPEIHSKEMLYVASSRLHLLTLLLAFLPFRNHAKGLMVISNNDVSALQVVIPLGYGIIDVIGLLFSSTLLLLGFSEGV